jgi:8-hydroxy-5-deazaflavin:NADPH oxidoreductase
MTDIGVIGTGRPGQADDLDGRTSSEIVASDAHHPGGQRVIFTSGDDHEAKAAVLALFQDAGFAVIDLGDLATGGATQQIHHPLAGLNLIRL